MRSSILLFILFPFSFFFSAEAAECYRLYLADKEGAAYCALSERALQRRERQGIALDSRDLCVSSQYKQTLRENGWTIVSESRWLNTVVVQQETNSEVGEESFAQFPFVSKYEQVTGSVNVPEIAASMRRQKWQCSASSQPDDNFRQPMIEVHGDALYQAGCRGEGMLVAVLDGGFQHLNALAPLMKKVEGWYDCYAPSDKEGEELWLASTHGTHVLSIMASDSAYGVWGSAPDARYFIIRTEWDATENPLEEDMWVRGAEIADSIGADLINSSLGYYVFDEDAFSHSWEDLGQQRTFVSQGARTACQKGILVCCSVGNARQRPWQKPLFPADVEEVFSVGGTDSSLNPSNFTSVGWISPNVKPDVCCRGTGSWYLDSMTGKPNTGIGTSFSCPLMCGLMASLWSADPKRTPAELRQIVRESASHYVSPDSLIGYGLPDFSKALKMVRPDLSNIESVGTTSERAIVYNLQGQMTRQKGLCVYKRKAVFVR